MTATTPNRFLLDARLEPLQGSRFAPTGFADLGPALFDRPSGDAWVKCLLVESAQSMANRLEGTLWDDGNARPIEAVAGLPYVRVVDPDGAYLTSSRTESHRLASPYIRQGVDSDGGGTGLSLLLERLELSDTHPHDYRRLARALFSLDPLVLVHGLFLSAKEFPGQPKFTRLVTGFVEADDVRAAESGGVKRDHVSHTQKSSGGGAEEGFGSIPFARTEWTARTIVASFNIDLAQLRSYGLPEPAQALLEALAKFEIATLLATPLRLRTNCDLVVVDDTLTSRSGEPLPSAESLADEVTELVAQCRNDGLVGDVVELTFTPKVTAKASK